MTRTTRTATPVDAARVELLLSELRLPGVNTPRSSARQVLRTSAGRAILSSSLRVVRPFRTLSLCITCD
jgi:hypothetical protein